MIRFIGYLNTRNKSIIFHRKGLVMDNDYLSSHESREPVPENNLSPEIETRKSFSFKKSHTLPGWTWRRIMILLCCVGASIAGGIVFGVLITYLGEIPMVSDLKAYKPSLSSKIYDSHGELITELFSEQRTLISLDNVPQHLQQAMLAIEDTNFYQHFGIQFSGIMRSLLVNFLHKRFQQGGSTITQQLARNMFLTRRKTIERKIKEIILALQIERTYTKREIFAMYFNQIYFGNGAYGIESASRSYFGKHVQNLLLPESALLAGLPRAPSAYNPYRHPKKALRRRNLVLTRMQRLGWLTPEEAEAAKLSPLKLSSVEISEAPYFVEYVRQQLETRFGSNAIYKAGLKVYTSLDLTLQRMAQDAFNEGLSEAEALIRPHLQTPPGRQPEPLQGALVLLEPATGEIKALIGGRDFQKSKFNRAVQAQRQPGSAFKPFIYTTAFIHGFTQADIILDTPVVFKDNQGKVWKPENFSNKFRGATTLRTALTKSRNVVTVKLLDKLGVKSVIQTAGKLGIQSSLKPYLTLALGASEVNLLELVSAYGCFPNRGIRVEPISILRTENNSGEILEENAPFRQEVLDETSAAIMTNLLENVINRGTGYGARRLGFKYPAGGKTGTTNDFSDAWFMGFTSEYAAGVWIGLDSHRSMGKGITGGKVACPIWTKLMLRIYGKRTPKKFIYPGSVKTVRFCNISGLLPNSGCKSHVARGAFAIGTAPTQSCDVHRASGPEGSLDYDLNLSPDLLNPIENIEATPDTDASDDVPAQPAATPIPPSLNDNRPVMF